MSVCACPQGIIRRDCDYHQEVARRFLETFTPTRTGKPIDGTYARGGYIPALKEGR